MNETINSYSVSKNLQYHIDKLAGEVAGVDEPRPHQEALRQLRACLAILDTGILTILQEEIRSTVPAKHRDLLDLPALMAKHIVSMLDQAEAEATAAND